MNNKSLGIGFVLLLAAAGIVGFSMKSKIVFPIHSNHTYFLKSDSAGKAYAANTPTEYSFVITNADGSTFKNFAITHTKLMHIIVIRTDLASFEHLHPDYDQTTGRFILTDITFPTDGQYRIFADFAPNDQQKDSMDMPLTTTLYEDIAVGNLSKYAPQPIETEKRSKTFDGMQVSLLIHGTPMSGRENMLMFNLSQNGKPVTDLQQYLGALGHTVILHEGNLAFIHTHPISDATLTQNGTVNFMVDFPEAGAYKVFTQFKRNNKVITTDFVVNVSSGARSKDMTMPKTGHSMH